MNTPLSNGDKVSLKAVLLHNGNKFPSVPLDKAVHVTQTHENRLILLQNIPYEEHGRIYIKVKVKQSRYRPGGAHRVPGSYGSQFS